MVSQLGLSSRALITAVDAARDGATVAFLHNGDTEYFRRLTRHLSWIRRVSCFLSYRSPNGYEINGEGEIWFRKVDAADLASVKAQIKHRVIVDHRLAEQAKQGTAQSSVAT